MALTPEDVVNKRFQPTKFREGYDQDEVDDFLDEVVVELRRLGQENEDLRQRLIASESRIAELQRSSVPATGEQAAQAPVQQLSYPTAQTEVGSVDPSNTNNLLQLARRLHEEHVREGVEKRDALIAEGHATAARVVAEAESKQRAQIGSLEQERSLLEHRIDELRAFEREYRQKLKGHLDGLLRELDASNVVTGSSSYGSVGVPTPSGFQGFGAN
ncbi:DivIVA domain-containing protein [Amnibacterium setariae]|uniref:Cell wall synthesis protein Wag31 n=1 Tax=Amnibacterium setariae TaxID=2306585 RepID=A0A3A1TV54_9MICO|nr:DivIVA domain-containing protein [Amnibacterium setariae]RIX27669.1 DivIVA domain-containing protein [Amnibacterium setariae]